MNQWVEVVRTTDLHPGKSLVVRIGDRSVAVFNVAGEYRAIDNACPHQGGPLSEGTLEGVVVTCPWHAWKYDVCTGSPVVTPSVATYEVRVRGDAVEIEVESADAVSTRSLAAEEDRISAVLERIQLGRTLDEVFEQIYEGLQGVVPHNRLGIALIDEESGKLVQVKTRSDHPIFLDDGYSASVSGTSLERMLASGDPRIIDDLKESARGRDSEWTALLLDEGMRSSLTLPLKVQGKPIGVVFFTSSRPRAFSESHIGFLQTIAGQLSILIEKGRWVSDLARSNERYRALFEMSNEGIFLCPSAPERFISANEIFCSWLGLTHRELSERSLRDLMHSGEFDKAVRLLDSLREGGEPVVFESELARPDGGLLPVEIRASRVAHRGGSMIQGFARNLSEVRALSDQLRGRYSFENLVGKSPKMQAIYELIEQVAPLSTTVLIQGESGTGKELVARAIHQNSPRRSRRFVAVNCGALVENLLESELFGHVRGAFTGAGETRPGRFERADGGTIFLDEVAELSPAMQVKLLRILQEGEFEKVGSTMTQKVDVRVVAASNQDLGEALKEGAFREDLFYRLNVVPIGLPPLRERRGDVPLLVRHFIRKFNSQIGKSIRDISQGALEALMDFPYPGNVRQLENIIEHSFVKCAGSVIEKDHLPPELFSAGGDLVSFALDAENPLEALEGRLIQKVVDQCEGKLGVAAQRLGISRVTLWRKLKRNS